MHLYALSPFKCQVAMTLLGCSGCLCRLPARSTPVLLMQQDWALGLVSLKFVHHTMAGIPDRRLLRRPYLATLRTYVWPPLQLIAALLSTPYLVTRGILPYCSLPMQTLQVSPCPK